MSTEGGEGIKVSDQHIKAIGEKADAKVQITDEELTTALGPDTSDFLASLSGSVDFVESDDRGTDVLLGLLAEDEMLRAPKSREEILEEVDRDIKKLGGSEREQYDALTEADEQSLPLQLEQSLPQPDKKAIRYLDHPDRPPEVHEAPKLEKKNISQVLEKLIPRWGQTQEEIQANIEDGSQKEVFTDVVQILDAIIAAQQERDEKFQDNKETKQKHAATDAAYKALTDPEGTQLQRNPENGAVLVPVTPDDGDGVTIGRKDGALYFDYSKMKTVIMDTFLGILKTDIDVLTRAREAAESWRTGVPLEIDDDLYDPTADPRITSLDQFLIQFMDTCDNAVEVVDSMLERETIEDNKSILSEKKANVEAVRAFFAGVQEKTFEDLEEQATGEK